MSMPTTNGVRTNETIQSSEDLETLVSPEEQKGKEQYLFKQIRELGESLVVS